MEEYTARSIKGLLEDLKGKVPSLRPKLSVYKRYIVCLQGIRTEPFYGIVDLIYVSDFKFFLVLANQQEPNVKGNTSIVDFTIDPISRACQTTQETLSRITTLIARSASERDFTTPGKTGDLNCPYATLDPARPYVSNRITSSRPYKPKTHCPPSISTSHRRKSSQPITDPISAEMNIEKLSSPPPSGSATGSAYKCPIRFLDQHSPEEVAQYFENHKHEIPRSHEVCVRRYQSNAASIRELDAKYGNLVNMIQGLGQKHKPMLPADEDIATQETPPLSNERVEMWANSIDADLKGLETAVETVAALDTAADDERENHFKRPMKEIRVGESPSRPWGIYVPPVTTPVPQATDQPTPRPAPNPSPQLSASAVPGRCPFSNQGNKILPNDHSATPGIHFQNNAAFIPPPAGTALPNHGLEPAPTPNFIFTGPVFIGYPFEQAMALAQQWKTDATASNNTKMDG